MIGSAVSDMGVDQQVKVMDVMEIVAGNMQE